MKLRQKSKRDQTLDAAASVAKTWSEWRLGEKVAKTASKAAKTTGKATKKAKKAKSSSRGPGKLKIAGAVALLAGIGAAVAKKFSGGKAEPLYTPPGPAPDMAPPPASPVAVGDLADGTPPSDKPTPPSTLEPAHTASKETPEPDPSPVVLEDLAGDGPAAAEAEETPPAADEPTSTADVPATVDLGYSSASDDPPAPADLASDTADDDDALGAAAAEDDGDEDDKA